MDEIQEKRGKGRPPLPEDKKKVSFSVRVSRKTVSRTQEICRRRSVHRMSPFSQAQLVEGLVLKTALPPKPSPEREAEYDAKFPPKPKSPARKK